MSLPSENKKPTGLSLSQLVQRNAEAFETREIIPYQHTVYAIPEEWRQREEQLLADAVQFQPTLYRQITNLATREESGSAVDTALGLAIGALLAIRDEELCKEEAALQEELAEEQEHLWQLSM